MLKTAKLGLFASIVSVIVYLAGVRAEAQTNGLDRYTLCSFRPQADACDAVYRQSLQDQSPAAVSVKEAFEAYGRYVRAASGDLTDDDRRFLNENGIVLPDLDARDRAGLHAFIHSLPPGNDVEARRSAVNNYIGHAVRAELYCDFNECNFESRAVTSASKGA